MLFLVMLFYQTALKIDIIKPVGTVSENRVHYKNSTLYRPTGEITISISCTDSRILINGEVIEPKVTEMGEYQLNLHNNDIVQLNTPEESGEQLSVFICESDPIISSPIKASRYVLERGYVDVFRVKFTEK